MGDALRDEIERIVRDVAPAGPPREWVRIEAEASARGFPSTRAFRAWCLARGVEVRESSVRDTWVRPAEVDRAVAGLPLVRRAAAPENDIDREIDRHHRR